MFNPEFFSNHINIKLYYKNKKYIYTNYYIVSLYWVTIDTKVQKVFNKH